MTIALLLIVYVAIGIWIALVCGEDDGYTALACGLIWLPCLVWYAIRKISRLIARAA